MHFTPILQIAWFSGTLPLKGITVVKSGSKYYTSKSLFIAWCLSRWRPQTYRPAYRWSSLSINLTYPFTAICHDTLLSEPDLFHNRQGFTYYSLSIFIDRKAGEIVRLVASVPLSVRLSVHRFLCQHSYGWTVWPMTLIFGMRVDLDLGWAGILSQGRRSKLRSNGNKSCFDITFSGLSTCFKVKVKGWGQGQTSSTTVHL